MDPMDVEPHNPTLHLALVSSKIRVSSYEIHHFNSNFDCKNNT